MARPKIVMVQHLRHALLTARLAKELGREVTLLSPPDAAAYLGPGWMDAIERALEARTGRRLPGVLDCGRRADLALAALRQGTRAILFRGPAPVAAKLAEIAAQRGATLLRRRPRALDLAGLADAEAALRRYLGAD